MQLRLERLASPIGTILLVTDDAGAIRTLDFEGYEPRMHSFLQRHCGNKYRMEDGAAPKPVSAAITAYFVGDLTAIEELPTATSGTAFQRKMWDALRNIPAGTTLTYGTFAKRLRRPTAIRAVGAANGANPISIVVPCHRLVGANGSLTGYGGGLDRKRWLIDHEQKFAGRSS
jgi:methylated-DNA-[protein]-cysteine S-methyltransferase